MSTLTEREKVLKILEYKEKINDAKKNILDMLYTGDIEKPSLELEIKKKIEDILHYISCIGTLWREDKTNDMNSFIESLRHFFSLCFSPENRMRKMTLELGLDYVNSLTIPIHVDKKWDFLIEIDTLLTRVKTEIKKH